MNNDRSSAMETITDIRQVGKYAGSLVYVEIGWNPYRSGLALVGTLLTGFSDGSQGYSTTTEITESGVHCMLAISDKDIERGTVKIRFATEDECRRVKLSYGRTAPVRKDVARTD